MQASLRPAVVAIALVAFGFPISDAAIDEQAMRPTAPGTLVWIGEHRLHLNCMGQGSPTVIFDSGLGGSSLDWVRVQSQVAYFTRACSYDRAGYGWSDAGPQPRDSARISYELERLLGNASVPGPYLLVGHSFGGFNVRLYSHHNPEQVAGLVLVDSSHEDQFRRFEESGLGSTAPSSKTFVVRNALQIPAALPENLVPVARSFARKRRSMIAFRSELRSIRRSAGQIRNATELPDVPIVIISHRINPAATYGTAAKRAQVWMDLQSDLAHLTTQGKHVIASTDDHYVHLSQPQLVVDSIRYAIERSDRIY